ncbi:MAG: acyl-ACP--UDP-N-acetylglucosamine O-acyltransferase [Methyloprofundus sp.]|nr:acyl-ACP--UDP-N-acetylglucosamine O-acyltransferase [Methyloprofundus sp.]
MTQNIHPSALIDASATIGENVSIGAFTIIEAHTQIGDNCKIGSHSVIRPYTKMGAGNTVHAQVVLGDIPQDTSFSEETVSYLEIGDNNTFREGFTAHRASEGATTTIGSNCFFMNNSHVAHDCKIGNHTIFANNVAIGGFVSIGERVFLGGNVVVHQFCRIGSYVMARGTTAISKDVLPFTLIAGAVTKHYRLNTVGLRRAGVTGARYKVLSTAFRLLKSKESIEHLEETEEMIYLKQWLAAESKRGIHGFLVL